jgi:hypothetical protein
LGVGREAENLTPLFRNQTVSLGIDKNGGRLFRRPKLTLSCSTEGKEGRKIKILQNMNIL